MRKTFNIRGGNYADVMTPTLEAFALVVCNWYFRDHIPAKYGNVTLISLY